MQEGLRLLDSDRANWRDLQAYKARKSQPQAPLKTGKEGEGNDGRKNRQTTIDK